MRKLLGQTWCRPALWYPVPVGHSPSFPLECTSHIGHCWNPPSNDYSPWSTAADRPPPLPPFLPATGCQESFSFALPPFTSSTLLFVSPTAFMAQVLLYITFLFWFPRFSGFPVRHHLGVYLSPLQAVLTQLRWIFMSLNTPCCKKCTQTKACKILPWGCNLAPPDGMSK